MIKVAHHLKFVTEFDETNDFAKEFLKLDSDLQVKILEDLLHENIVPRMQEILDEVNEGGSYAILRIAEAE